jgi:NADH-quinone oxidoreductase subunit J
MNELAFALLATVTLVGAVGVVAARSVFVSAVFLVLSFFGVAGLYVALGAAFLGVIQVLIYVGAISVLILFAVMLTPNLMEAPTEMNRQTSLALTASLLVFGLLALIGFGTAWQVNLAAVAPGTGVVVSAEAAKTVPYVTTQKLPDGKEINTLPDPTVMLGKSFMSDQLLAFEVISVILLVALLGAIVIARE